MKNNRMNRAVFLDKDGTLINDVPYNVDPDLIVMTAGAPEALAVLKENGYLLVLISNQSGVARGYFREAQLAAVRTRIDEELMRVGVQLDGFYFCPHHPCGIVDNYAIDCACRKPKPGLLLQAANDLNIDLTASWMIGDILDDVEAGNRAGCRTILLDNGNETEWLPGPRRSPLFIVQDFYQCIETVLTKPQVKYDFQFFGSTR